jgi:hypothetical protein
VSAKLFDGELTSTCARVTLPTFSVFDLPEPVSTPAAATAAAAAAAVTDVLSAFGSHSYGISHSQLHYRLVRLQH